MNVMTIGGMSHPCCGDGMVTVSTEDISMLVVHGKPLGFDLLLGIDTIKVLGGMVVRPIGSVQPGNNGIVKWAAISINEPGFTATFNHWSPAWTVVSKWSEGRAPEALDNRVVEYPVAAQIQEDYEWELCTWMCHTKRKNWDPSKGLNPLMAVLQSWIFDSSTVMLMFSQPKHVCAAKLREWRQKGSNVSLFDLKRAYLPDHEDWRTEILPDMFRVWP